MDSQPKMHDLEFLFHPRSVAIIGLSGNPDNRARMLLDGLLRIGFKGPVYPVHPSGGDLNGLKVYPSLSDIPDPVDHAIISVPAHITPRIIKECAAKGVKSASIFTAGFSEIGDEDREELQVELSQVARKTGVRVIGPNGMGIYCPRAHLSWSNDFPKEGGNVGCLSQSGGNSNLMVKVAAAGGARFSKVISYGNACDLNECDFLEYFLHDPETEIITAYIEGVRDGPRFSRLLREAARVKPVIALKAGRTEGGTRATAGHTGSLAGSSAAWDALCRQTGAIQVDSIEEMADTAVTFSFMSPPRGRRVVVVSRGGGASVESADTFESAGLSLPPLPSQVRTRLRAFTPDAGNILRNPIDMTSATDLYKEVIIKTVKILAEWSDYDILVFLIYTDMYPSTMQQDFCGGITDILVEVRKVCSKPIAVVLYPGTTSLEAFTAAFKGRQKLVSAGFPSYPSLYRAASAISKFIRYHEESRK